MVQRMTVNSRQNDLPGDQASLTERAYREIEELIVTLQLAPGQILSEVALAQRLGIGRTPVREALQRLAREGLVVIASGTCITSRCSTCRVARGCMRTSPRLWATATPTEPPPRPRR
jgi:DNA-binding GntR family transcriptional regulator